jgi:hypothetical protein
LWVCPPALSCWPESRRARRRPGRGPRRTFAGRCPLSIASHARQRRNVTR